MNSEKQGGRTKDVIHTTFKIQSELNFCVLNWEFDMCNIMLVTFKVGIDNQPLDTAMSPKTLHW